jgi:hypothetical protein
MQFPCFVLAALRRSSELRGRSSGQLEVGNEAVIDEGSRGLYACLARRPATILHHHKYPREDEARAKIIYYREARDRVSVFHQAEQTSDWLTKEASSLDLLASRSSGSTRTRLRNNARGLHQYAAHFGDRKVEVLDELKFKLDIGDVRITAVPDLHIREKHKIKLVKLRFGSEVPDPRLVKIISQVLFQAAVDAGFHVSAKNIEFVDVPRGLIRTGARAGARLQRDIEAACQTISDVWDSLQLSTAA